MTPWQIIGILGSVIATLAATLWGFSLRTIADLKKQVAAKDEALNACRNATLSEVKAASADALKSLGESTRAQQAATAVLEGRFEVEDRILGLAQAAVTTAQQAAGSIQRLDDRLDRIERQTETCLRGPLGGTR